MYTGIQDALRGSRFQELRLDTIANNLANVGTAGFKKDIPYFDQALRSKVRTSFASGSIRQTGNALDAALDGEGFFKVQTDQGTRYTRDGRFALNASGQLVTPNGDFVMGTAGPITIEGTDVSIDTDGRIQVDGEEAGQIAVVNFEQSDRVRKIGQSYYVYHGKETEEMPAEETLVQGGYIEESNVQVTEEMIRMVEALRTFESYQKVLQTFDETDAKAINEVGKL